MKKKQVVSYYNYKMALIKYRYPRTPVPHQHNSTIHAIPYCFIGIICGPIWGSFLVRVICSPIWRSFAVRDHLRSWDHLRTRTDNIREFKKLRRRRRGERRLKKEFIFYLRISWHSEVIYFVFHCQNYHETKSRTQ